MRLGVRPPKPPEFGGFGGPNRQPAAWGFGPPSPPSSGGLGAEPTAVRQSKIRNHKSAIRKVLPAMWRVPPKPLPSARVV